MVTHTVTPTPRVLILGHSFIRRLQKFMEHHIGYLDLSLQITASADIAWHGIGGRTVAKTVKFNLHVVRSTRPDIVIVQVGTNDLPFQSPLQVGSKEIINWKVAYQTSFQCTKSSKLITFNFKLLHRRLPTNCFLKKVGLRDDDKCSFCNKETENLIHLFWRCEKTKNFWDSLFKWMQSCQLSLGEHNYLHINTALGLRPDRSKHKLQINFCCLIAKHYIWLCRSKEHSPNLNNFLLYLKHIYQIENNASTVKNKWEPLLPYISLLT